MPKQTSGMCTASESACSCRACSRYSWSTGASTPLRESLLAELHLEGDVVDADEPYRRARLRLCRRDPQEARDAAREDPVVAAEELHRRRDEQRADHRRVEDDPGREPDRELLDVRPRPGREREEREHQHGSGARDELARPREPV